MGFQKGQKRTQKDHPLSYLTPQQRWEAAIEMLASMYGNWFSSKDSPEQPRLSPPEPRRRPQKPIRLHVVYEDFDGTVWHEHDSIYPEPQTADAPAGSSSPEK
jgi:hypothetical protein